MILTDEEIATALNLPFESFRKTQAIEDARAIEALLMSKLAEQAWEPVACAAFAENGNIRIWSSVSEPVRKLAEAEGMNLVRLYTEAQLIAAQQRTAKSCAKYLQSRSDKMSEYESRNKFGVQVGAAAFDSAAKRIRNGEWREYL